MFYSYVDIGIWLCDNIESWRGPYWAGETPPDLEEYQYPIKIFFYGGIDDPHDLFYHFKNSNDAILFKLRWG